MRDVNVSVDRDVEKLHHPLRCLVAEVNSATSLPGNPACNKAAPHQYSFCKTFKECLTSFTFDLIGLSAGFIFAHFLGIFTLAPWTIATYPAILTAKGIIVGLLAGRLGTALHLGTIYPRFIGNTRAFYRLFDVIIVVNLLTSLFMSTVAIFFGIFLWGVRIGEIFEIVLNVIATMALGLTISLLTAYISFFSFKFGWDPDVVVYPIMSSTADSIITAYYALIIAMFFLLGNEGRASVIAINVLYLIISAFVVIRDVHDTEFIKSIKEILLTLVVIAFIVNITGTFLKGISAVIEERKEVYIAYPPLIDMIGDAGSVIGATATTKLALGLINPSLRDLRRLKEHISASWLSSIIILTVVSIVSLAISGIFELSCFAWLTLVLLMVDAVAIPLIFFISYLISILTFRRGFDPDNFVIPIESSLADSIATLSLFFVLFLIGR